MRNRFIEASRQRPHTARITVHNRKWNSTMSSKVMEEFKRYAEFSVRADQYFYAINTYGINHGNLKAVSAIRPFNDLLQSSIEKEITDGGVKQFLISTVATIDNLRLSGLFSDAKDLVSGAIDPQTIPPDISNFAFYTCFCFQWSLFENFVKDMMQKLIDAHALPISTRDKLQKCWSRTKKFFDVIDSGEIFGHSPFHTVLPLMAETGNFQVCDYADLDKIRELRNDFIHGIESPQILPISALEKQRHYERSMWILRQFATNIQFDVSRRINNGSDLEIEQG